MAKNLRESDLPGLEALFEKLGSGEMPDFLEVMRALSEISRHNNAKRIEICDSGVVPDGSCTSCNS